MRSRAEKSSLQVDEGGNRLLQLPLKGLKTDRGIFKWTQLPGMRGTFQNSVKLARGSVSLTVCVKPAAGEFQNCF